MVTNYQNAKWGIETSARVQAEKDAENTEINQCRDYLGEWETFGPLATRVLQSWVKNHPIGSLFVLVPKYIYDALEDNEREDLVQMWIEEYVNCYYRTIANKVRNHLEGVTNDTYT